MLFCNTKQPISQYVQLTLFDWNYALFLTANVTVQHLVGRELIEKQK